MKFLGLLPALLLLPGCTLISLNEQTRAYSTATVLAGAPPVLPAIVLRR